MLIKSNVEKVRFRPTSGNDAAILWDGEQQEFTTLFYDHSIKQAAPATRYFLMSCWDKDPRKTLDAVGNLYRELTGREPFGTDLV